MQPRNLTYGQQQDYESHAPYLKIWAALLVLTVLEYGYARAMAGGFHVLVVGLLALALIKAVLVGLYFMHVRFEGRWVYFFIVPVTILAAALVIALVPDIAMETVGARENGPEVFLSAPLDADAGLRGQI